MGNDRAHLVSDRGIEGPPHLVVEVASPSTAGRDRGIKLERYRPYGVDMYWILDGDRGTLEEWELVGGPSEPRVLGRDEVLRWAPFDGGAVLELSVGEVLDGA